VDSENPSLVWSFDTYSALTLDGFYDLLKLRIDVFVVEQTCAYPELDAWDKHPETRHVQVRNDSAELIACARLVYDTSHPAGPSVKIGRVAVAPTARGRGVASELVKRAVSFSEDCWKGAAVRLSAQVYIKELYSELGFAVESGEYLEDGIPHIDMVLVRA